MTDGNRSEKSYMPERATPTTERHLTWVAFGMTQGRGETWQPMCEACGKVGRAQDRSANADAIATRHFEQGGFEGRGE